MATPRPRFTIHQLNKTIEKLLTSTPRLLQDITGILPYPTDKAVEELIRHVDSYATVPGVMEAVNAEPLPPKHELEEQKVASANKVRKAVVRMRVEGKFEPRYKAGSFLYVAYHKPAGVLCSRSSDAYETSSNASRKRKRKVFLYETLPKFVPPVPHIGRLDKDTEGLLLLTDDGSLHEPLLSKDFTASRGKESAKASKVYFVDVRAGGKMMQDTGGLIDREAVLESMRKPLEYERKENPKLNKAREVLYVSDPALVSFASMEESRELFSEYPLVRGAQARLRVEIGEGRNRQVRRLCARAGLIVIRLLRYQFGPVSLSGLAQGEARNLTKHEVEVLYKKHALLEGQCPKQIVCGQATYPSNEEDAGDIGNSEAN